MSKAYVRFKVHNRDESATVTLREDDVVVSYVPRYDNVTVTAKDFDDNAQNFYMSARILASYVNECHEMSKRSNPGVVWSFEVVGVYSGEVIYTSSQVLCAYEYGKAVSVLS